MANYKPSILIIEDDISLGEALKQAFVRLEYNVFLTSRPDEVDSILQQNRIDYLFSDCLLPQTSGVDLVIKIKQQFGNQNFKVVMMSGIYTDKLFVKETLQKTKAISFLQKPFELEDAISLVKQDVDQKVNQSKAKSSRRNLYQFFSSNKLSRREKKLVLENLDDISGFDIPFILSILAESKSTGYLNLYSEKGTVFGVSFSNGMITNVDVEDRKTVLGEMLIQSGYVNPVDLKSVLEDKRTNLKLGQKLIQANLLSPHAFDLILLEQMNIRLSYIINEEKYKINFAAADVDLQKPYIDQEALLNFLHDLIVSKISNHWLQSIYKLWGNSKISLNKAFTSNHEILGLPVFANLEGLYQELKLGKTASDLITSKKYNETALLKGMHLLLTKGLIFFEDESTLDLDPSLRLEKLSNEILGKSDNEVVEYFGGFLSGTFNTNALIDALTALGSEPSADNLKVTWANLKAKIEKAFHTVQLEEQSNIYSKTNVNSVDNKIKVIQMGDELKKIIFQMQFSKAQKIIHDIEAIDPKFPQLKIYKAWTKLGLIQANSKDKSLKEIEFELMQVPPDEKYDYLYSYVMGLYYKHKNDLINARKSFEKSMAMDSSFILARRELNLVQAEQKKGQQDIFSMDLKDVVSGFFKRGKK